METIFIVGKTLIPGISCVSKLIIHKRTTLPKKFLKEIITVNQGRILHLMPGTYLLTLENQGVTTVRFDTELRCG